MGWKFKKWKTLPKEVKTAFDDVLGNELGEQIDNWADFMRLHTDYRRRDRLPKEKQRYGVFSLTLFERLDQVIRIDNYFRYTKPCEFIV